MQSGRTGRFRRIRKATRKVGDAQAQERNPAFSWRSALLGGLVTLVVMSLVPGGQLLFKRIWLSLVPPNLEVQVYSVLISRSKGDPVADVKVRIWLQNGDFSDLSVQPMYLKNEETGDSIDLTSTHPMRIAAQSYARDSVSVSQRANWRVFGEIPSASTGIWSLAYKMIGQDKISSETHRSIDIERLHFFLLPSGMFRPGGGARIPPAVVNRVRHLYQLDSTGWVDRGLDSFKVLIYPPDEVEIGFDFNEDGKTDTILLAVDMRKDSVQGTPGRMHFIAPVLDHYFDDISGFAFALGGNQIVPDSVLFNWFPPSAEKDLSRVFGSIVDAQIPLAGKEFIYWQYKVD